jgi:anti-sigma regulatory factor (Ser/Thr protein kinase)
VTGPASQPDGSAANAAHAQNPSQHAAPTRRPVRPRVSWTRAQLTRRIRDAWADLQQAPQTHGGNANAPDPPSARVPSASGPAGKPRAVSDPYAAYRPEYTVVLAISPQMRVRHPEWPLSLEEALSRGHPEPGRNRRTTRRSFWAELSGSLQAPSRTRAIVRDTLAEWNLTHLTDDAELLASELVANAAEHAPGQPIGLSLREHTAPDGRPFLRCAVSDTCPSPPRTRAVTPDSERGRGLALVATLATSSGWQPTSAGKTTWFTLANGPQRQAELEPGA